MIARSSMILCLLEVLEVPVFGECSEPTQRYSSFDEGFELISFSESYLVEGLLELFIARHRFRYKAKHL